MRDGGAGGIRTLDRALQPYNGLANRRLQPLGHSSVKADMPDVGVSRKRQIRAAGFRAPITSCNQTNPRKLGGQRGLPIGYAANAAGFGNAFTLLADWRCRFGLSPAP